MNTESRATTADVLFGSGEHTTALADLLAPLDLGGSALRGARKLTASGRNMVEHEINSAASRLLDIDLSEVLIGGWLRYDRLRRAAANTRSGGSECVPLARHRIDAIHRPWIELRSNGVPIGRLDFEIRTSLEVDGVNAVVENAALQNLRCGECAVSVVLSVDPRGPVAQRSRKLPVWQVIQLRHPIPLLGRRTERGTVPAY